MPNNKPLTSCSDNSEDFASIFVSVMILEEMMVSFIIHLFEVSVTWTIPLFFHKFLFLPRILQSKLLSKEGHNVSETWMKPLSSLSEMLIGTHLLNGKQEFVDDAYHWWNYTTWWMALHAPTAKDCARRTASSLKYTLPNQSTRMIYPRPKNALRLLLPTPSLLDITSATELATQLIRGQTSRTSGLPKNGNVRSGPVKDAESCVRLGHFIKSLPALSMLFPLCSFGLVKMYNRILLEVVDEMTTSRIFC